MSKLRRHRQRVLQVVPRFLSKVTGIREDKPGACVTYSKLLASALNKLGYRATMIPIQYVVGNDSHKVGVGLNDEYESDGEYFHAVVLLYQRREIIDLTITQASRPQYGWECKPFWVKVNSLPEYILKANVPDFEPPSKLYDSMTNPDALAEALAMVIDGAEVEVVRR